MRTTLAIDDDVLTAARALAEQQGKSVGEIVSELARSGLRRPSLGASRNGVPLLPVQDKRAVVTLDLVNRLRDESP